MKAVLFFFLTFYTIVGFAINPKKDYISTPKDYNINYKEVTVENNDVNIRVWISEPSINSLRKDKIKTILLVYGDYGNMSYYLPYIAFYVKLGFRVVSFDYRGFGKSSSFNIDPKRLFYNEFTTDFKNVLLYCKNVLNIKNIGIAALSMGTIVTAVAMQDENVEFIIAEGCVYDVDKVVERLRKIKQKEIIITSDYELPYKWKMIKCKILIFVADNDVITDLKDGNDIVSQDIVHRKLITYKGDHLSMLYNTNELEYFEQKINLFVNGN